MNDSSESIPTTSPQPAPVLELRISGKIPSFKTGKRGTIAKTPDGKEYGRVVTSREDRARMKEIIRAIESQLLSAYHREAATQTANTVPSWIASSVPLNDSAAWIKSLTVEVDDQIVPEGEELAVIRIEKV